MNLYTILLTANDGGGLVFTIIAIIVLMIFFTIYNGIREKQKSFEKPLVINFTNSGTFYKVLEMIDDKILLRSGLDIETATNERWYDSKNIPEQLRFIGRNFWVFNKDGDIYFKQCTDKGTVQIIEESLLHT